MINILRALGDAGYQVGDMPETGDALIHALIDRCSYDQEFLTDAAGRARRRARCEPADYAPWFDRLHAAVQARAARALGRAARHGVPRRRRADRCRACYSATCSSGIQPPRGFGENPIAIYHNPDLPPTHHYLAFYRWLRDDFGAHAIVHVGKHGTLEWLPGKAVGPSAAVLPGGRRSRTCRTSTRSSSTTPARAPRPSAAPTPRSSTTSSRR